MSTQTALTQKQEDILLHTLGLPSDLGAYYRNGYATGPGCDGWDNIQVMVSCGLMIRGRDIPGSWIYFHATDEGKRQALELNVAKLPKHGQVAWLVEFAECRSICAALSDTDAIEGTIAKLRELDYDDVQADDLIVRRAPKFDAWAAIADRHKGYDEDYLMRTLGLAEGGKR